MYALFSRVMDSLTFHSCEIANLAGLNEGIGNTVAPLTVSDILQVKEIVFLTSCLSNFPLWIQNTNYFA